MVRSALVSSLVALAVFAGSPASMAIAGSPALAPAANPSEKVKAYVDAKLAPFLNGLGSLKEELKAANKARAGWAAFSEDWKKWSPADAEQHKDSYTYGEYLWSGKKDKAFRAAHIDTPAGKALKEFQEKSGGAAAELFATDAKGGNVCQSQPTSDWFQGDEEKFQKVDGKKDCFYAEPKRDDTVGQTVVQVSVPIWEKDAFLGFVCVSVVVEKLN